MMGQTFIIYGASMITEPFDANEIIQQMIELHIQRKHIQAQIKALNPIFYKACEAQESDRFRREQATIFRHASKGSWTYPSHILEAEEHLKQLKKAFEETHEPSFGRNNGWTLRLAGVAKTDPSL